MGYEREKGVKNLYISFKIIQKPYQRESLGINF